MQFINFFGNIRNKATFAIAFIQKDLWKIRLKTLKRPKALGLRILRILVVTLTGIRTDAIKLQASALSLFTMLAIVPLLAMAFGIAKGFGLETLLKREIIDTFSGQEEVLQYAMNYAESMLENTQGGMIAGVSLLVLFWSVARLLIRTEGAFNIIWNVHKARPPLRKFTDFFSMLFIAPVFLVLANSATVVVLTKIKAMTESTELLSWFSPVVIILLQLIPYVLFWLLFTLVYIIMPNTRVHFKSALLAAIIAGTAFQLLQWGYINFQLGVSRYNAIYGSFAALPLFIIWLFISWWIVLIGAKLAYAHQNISRYEFGWNTIQPSNSFNKYLALLIVRELAVNFEAGKPPMTLYELAGKLETPWLFVDNTTDELENLGIVTQVQSNGNAPAYQPGKDIHHLTVAYVLEAIERYGEDDIAIAENSQTERLREILFQLKKDLMNSEANLLIKNL